MPSPAPHSHIPHTILALALVATAIPRGTSNAATLTFPTVGCNTTLQACVTAAAPGDTVEIATNLPISEDLLIDKSLTLRPAPGFSPVLNDNASVSLLNTAGKSNSIAFEGITLNHGYVQARQLSTQPFDVRIRNISVTDTYNDHEAIDIGTGLSGLYGPVTFDIAENDIRIPDSVNSITAISVNGLSASTFTGTIRNNKILHLAGNEGGAIGVFNYSSELAVDVIGNHITGSNYNTGINFFQFGPGDAHLRVINNFVDGQITVSGHPGAVAISTGEGDATFEVLNNTLVNSDSGISVTGRHDLGATWGGLIANNIVSYITDWGLSINNPFSTVTNEHNLLFDVGGNSFSPGPNTLYVDPQFTSPTDFRLTPGSPAQNFGNTTRVPADILTDLQGFSRIQGPAVDLGAYELAVPEPSTTMLLLPSLLTTACRVKRAIRRSR